MSKKGIPAGEPFPVEEIVSATPEGAQAYRDQSAVLEAAAIIRQMREGARLTQRELAQRIGTTQPHISELERGTGTQGPTFLMLRRIAKACGTELRVEVGSQGEAASVQAVAEEKLAQAHENVREALSDALGSSPALPDLANQIAAMAEKFSTRMTDWVFCQPISEIAPRVAAMRYFVDNLPDLKVMMPLKGGMPSLHWSRRAETLPSAAVPAFFFKEKSGA